MTIVAALLSVIPAPAKPTLAKAGARAGSAGIQVFLSFFGLSGDDGQ
jgi:hypothetical protein